MHRTRSFMQILRAKRKIFFSLVLDQNKAKQQHNTHNTLDATSITKYVFDLLIFLISYLLWLVTKRKKFKKGYLFFETRDVHFTQTVIWVLSLVKKKQLLVLCCYLLTVNTKEEQSCPQFTKQKVSLSTLFFLSKPRPEYTDGFSTV